MARSNKWAAGKFSWGICDRCGVRTKYSEMRGETIRARPTGVRVCWSCWDKDHEQNFLPEAVVVDAQALRDARPDTGLAASRVLYPNANWPPYPPGPSFRDDKEHA
jgi:hypothetical protein